MFKMMGSELEFISILHRDGSGTSKIKKLSSEYYQLIQHEMFELKRLSITEDTFLAFNFNVFVVKIKKTIKLQESETIST